MEHIIAKLLQEFEQGKMSRRQLIQSLALTATAASAATAVPAAGTADTGFKAIGLSHISFNVDEYTKMRDFYAGLFGMRVWAETKAGCRLECGNMHFSMHQSPANTPHLDHIAIRIQKYDQKMVDATLNRRGIPVDYSTGEPKIKDPAGLTVQIVDKNFALCCSGGTTT